MRKVMIAACQGGSLDQLQFRTVAEEEATSLGPQQGYRPSTHRCDSVQKCFDHSIDFMGDGLGSC